VKNNQHPATNGQHRVLAVATRHWLSDVGFWFLVVPQFFLLLCLRAYKILISPLLTVLCGPLGGCRFTPTCSVYAMDAIREHGAGKGSWLAAKRICRCRPWGGCGHDPVPEKKSRITHHASRIAHS
jgi:putative membrane protein insertion efficiency factor